MVRRPFTVVAISKGIAVILMGIGRESQIIPGNSLCPNLIWFVTNVGIEEMCPAFEAVIILAIRRNGRITVALYGTGVATITVVVMVCSSPFSHDDALAVRDFPGDEHFRGCLVPIATGADNVGVPDLAAFTVVVVGHLYRLAAIAFELPRGIRDEAIEVVVPLPAANLMALGLLLGAPAGPGGLLLGHQQTTERLVGSAVGVPVADLTVGVVLVDLADDRPVDVLRVGAGGHAASELLADGAGALGPDESRLGDRGLLAAARCRHCFWGSRQTGLAGDPATLLGLQLLDGAGPDVLLLGELVYIGLGAGQWALLLAPLGEFVDDVSCVPLAAVYRPFG